MATPPVLLLDDGELDDIRSLLGELEIGFTSPKADVLAGAAAPLPARLFVATARYALRTPARTTKAEEPVRVAILSEDSSTLRGRLQALGFEYLVRRPVHPEALRLLLLRLLYRGDERRASERLPIGSAVSYRAGLWRRKALVAEISTSGCRLLTPRGYEPSTPLTVQLPKELVGGEALSLAGRVVRSERKPNGDPGLAFVTALAFEPLPPESEDRLRALLHAKARGPETLPEATWTRPRLRPGEVRRLALTSLRAHFRRSPRRSYRSRVAAMDPRDKLMRVLMGRNLSTGGMLVEPHPDLGCGDKLTLAIFGRPGDRILVKADVARDDGDAGLALRFEEPSAEVKRRLEQIVSGLPHLEQLTADATRATVVAEMEELERRRPAGRVRRRARA